MNFPKPNHISPATIDRYATVFKNLMARTKVRHPNARGWDIAKHLVGDIIADKSVQAALRHSLPKCTRPRICSKR